MFTGETLYKALQYWGPVIGGFTIVIRAYFGAKTSVGDWADKLLNNHLHSIEVATQSTEVETKRTNTLLQESASKVDQVALTIAKHNEHEALVWAGVLTSLEILKDRGARPRTPRSRRAKRT